MNPRHRRELPPDVLALADALGAGAASASAASIEHAAVAAAMAASRMAASLLLVVPTAAQADRVGTLARWLLANGPVPYGFPRWPRGAESPYEEVVESPFVAAARAGTLGTFALADAPFVLTLDAPALARRTVPFDAYMEGVQRLEVGREVDRDALAALLTAAGYRRAATVAEVGEFAVRGGVVDLFSPFAEDPVRVDLDGDTIASLKHFDAATQRTQRTASATWVVPAWEVPADPERLREARIRLADAAAELRVPSREVAAAEAQIDAGRVPPAFAAMLPLLHGTLDLPTAYLSGDALVAIVDPAGCEAAASAAMDGLRSEHAATSARPRLVAPPGALAVDGPELLASLADRPRTLRLDLATTGVLGPVADFARGADLVRATTPDAPVAQRVAGLVGLARDLADTGRRMVVVSPSDAEARRVRDVLDAEGLDPEVAGANGLNELLDAGAPVRVGVGRLRTTVGLDPLGVLVVPSEAVFGLKDHLAGRRGERRGVMPLPGFRELAPGDLVIHRDHGIGSFEGLKEFAVDGRTTECLVLSYKGGDRLYVPVERSDLLERYVAPGEGAARELDRLGGQAWVKRKRSARKAAQEIAGKLRLIYARRLAASAEPMSPPDAEFREFEATFPFETTPDQERAIEEVLEDLARDRPMDRLVCGDVGFGKTEVAVRAAYKAAMDGHQVAVLVPTTILAEQHRLTFAARLRNTPIRVESLSRFKSPAGARDVLAGVRSGAVDVVIGTHRLLSKDVVFRDLGLLVIDEEHRFGVAHKERLREIAASVHTLTLTATPIPRTLHMALSGIRDLSVIATPPRDRLAVKTFVARSSRDLVRSALLRELNRGGQVFVVHNRVEDIYEFASGIASLVPEARVTVAHGQMSAPDLEDVMSAFVRGDKDVLVCTTIVESGLDVGTANTMLISGADSLGLAQLYQLRGRVGRAAEQAYCYLLVRDPATLTDDARKRIEAIERFSELSSGFNLASMDLEIRGAGDVLGADQSGHMAAVGYDLFMEMVSEAVAELAGEAQPERVDPELKLDVEARIPADAIPDERLRLRFYKRLAAARDLPEVAAVASEIADRFGRLPPAVERLAAFMRIKLHARALGLAQVGLNGATVQASAASGHPASVPAVLVAAVSAGWQIVPGGVPGRARVQMPRSVAADARLAALEDLLVLAAGMVQAGSPRD
jgi:transcription-repair coupling factor (superfamily II helicase)